MNVVVGDITEPRNTRIPATSEHRVYKSTEVATGYL